MKPDPAFLYGGLAPVSSCPAALVSFLRKLFADGEMKDETLSALYRRVCCAPDMQSVWHGIQVEGMSDIDYVEVAMVFVMSLFSLKETSTFEEKTNAERRSWLKATCDAASRLRDLLNESPGFAAENVIEAVPEDGMRWFLGLLGVHIIGDQPYSAPAVDADGSKWLVSEGALSRAQRGTYPLGLVDLLDTLIAEVGQGVPSTQTLKKPRDAKAFRASYILRITERTNAAPFHLTDEQVATVARVMLGDEAITAALANRFRWRVDKDVNITP